VLTRPRRTILAALTLAVTAALPVAPASAAGAACPDDLRDPGYPDVAASNTHAGSIKCVAWWEITTGSGFGTYEPAQQVRREQMATFIARLVESIGGDLPSYGSSDFEDVSYSSPHRNNISRLADVGIVQGTSTGYFSPSATVTRAQMATFLVRAAEFAKNQALPAGGDAFDDDNGNAHEANINKVAAAGIASGVGDRRYNPSGVVQRDQMATFMSRVLNRSVEQGDTFVPVEQISFEQTGDALTDLFRLRSGAEYKASYEFRDDCFYGQFLDAQHEEDRSYSLGSDSGPASGEDAVTDVVAGTYRIQTFTSDDCSWSLTLTRVR
jgi:hypothetical protein